MPRRRPQSRFGPALKLGGAGFIALAVMGGSGWLWWSGIAERTAAAAQAQLLQATVEMGLAVRQVLVEGRDESSRTEVLQALDIRRGQPILAVDPERARTRLEVLPWVRSAAVERRLPDVVYVQLVERRPLALWQRQGRIVVIDREGAVLTDQGVERFAKLPLIVGDDAPQHAEAFLSLLAKEPALFRRVSAAVYVGGRRWNLRLDDRVDVRLPEGDPAAAWARLADLERDHKVLEREVQAIDLRVPDRLILELEPGAAKRLHDPGRST